MIIADKYFLESTNDTTDRKSDIEAKLNEFGACVLGSGVFYVSGVDMPDNSTLMGLGYSSRLMLDTSLEEGYAIKMAHHTSVKDLYVAGAEKRIPIPESVGTRHGILFKGTATPERYYGQPENSIIEGCYVTSFTGGGITCADTGYCTNASVTASNCHVINCGAGINISHFSEFHKFTNIISTQNIYGCINNGGNNVFTACGFDSNKKTGFLIDNEGKKSHNDSHGSVLGCTFNHNGNNQGNGIEIIFARSGYVFTGCQMFYSKIVLVDSKNIVFNSMNFGRNEDIQISGGDLTIFNSCAFANEPILTIENNDKVRFSSCYTVDGKEVTLV